MEIGCINDIWLHYYGAHCIKYHSFDDEGIVIFLPKLDVCLLKTISFLPQYHGQGREYESVLRNINVVFTALFTVEAILKIFGFGIKVIMRQIILINATTNF